MSYETVVFQEQLDKLDAADAELKESHKTLTDLICSGMYKDRVDFQKKIRDFSSKIITLVQTIQQPVEGVPVPKPEDFMVKPEGEKVEKSKFEFGYPQAGLLGVGIVACLVLAVYGLIPPMTGVYVVIACVGLSFGPSLASFLSHVFRRDGAEEAAPKPLDDWIAESLQWMLDRYDGTRYLAMVQNQKPEDLPNEQLLGIPEELYIRSRQNEDTMPGEFLGKLVKIMVECNKAFTVRKTMIYAAMTAVKQAQPVKA